MQLISISEVFYNLENQINKSTGLKTSLGNNLIYSGIISEGCKACYKNDEFQISFTMDGEKCNYSCPFCYSNYKKRDFNQNDLNGQIQYAIKNLVSKSEYIKNKVIVNFSAEANEPLTRMDYIQDVVLSLDSFRKECNLDFYYKIYSNGYYANEYNLKILKRLKINEIRFNLAASLFNDNIYKNICISREYIDVITVETPLWEPYRELYFSMISKLDKVNIDNLILGEVVLTKENISRVLNTLDSPRVYLNGEMYVYNATLFFDIYRVYKSLNCKYSILYCNSTLKNIRDLFGKELLENFEKL